MNDGDGPHLSAPLADVVSESGLRSGPGVRVYSNILPDPAIHWSQRKVEYPSPPQIRGTKYLTYILNNHGGGAIFLTRGFPRVGYESDRATRALHALSQPGIYDNCGVEQPTPPMVFPL